MGHKDRKIIEANAGRLATWINTKKHLVDAHEKWTPQKVVLVFTHPMSDSVTFEDRMDLVEAGTLGIALNLKCWRSRFARVRWITGAERSQISRALRGEPGVSDTLRRQIIRAAQRFDYEPRSRSEASAKIPVARRTFSRYIAWKVPLTRDVPEDINDYWVRFSAAIYEECVRVGLTIIAPDSIDEHERLLGLVFWGTPRSEEYHTLANIRAPIVFLNTTPEAVLAGMLSEGIPPLEKIDEEIKGRLLKGIPLPPDRRNELVARGIPFHKPVAYIRSDDREAMHQLVHHLLAAGVKRPILIRGPKSGLDWLERIAGYQDVMGDNSWILPSLDEDDTAGMFLPEHGYRQMSLLLKHEDFSQSIKQGIKQGIIAANDAIAGGVIEAVKEKCPYVEIGSHLLITGWDDSPGAEKSNLTSVKQPCEEYVREAIRTIFMFAQVPDADPLEIVLRCRLKIRDSTMGESLSAAKVIGQQLERR